MLILRYNCSSLPGIYEHIYLEFERMVLCELRKTIDHKRVPHGFLGVNENVGNILSTISQKKTFIYYVLL